MSSIQQSFAVNPGDTFWEGEYHASSSAVSFNILKIKYNTYPIYSFKSSNCHFCKHRHWSGKKILKFNKTEVEFTNLHLNWEFYYSSLLFENEIEFVKFFNKVSPGYN